VSKAIIDISDELQDARLNRFMSPCSANGSLTGILGFLQRADSLSTKSVLFTLEQLKQCVSYPFGMAIALESREMLDWLDGLCITLLRREMSRRPEVFEALCLQGDQSVLQSPNGKEFSETDGVKAFLLIRSILVDMDNLDAKELERYRSLLIERRTALLEQAIHAAERNEPYFEQLEWKEGFTIVKCGRFSSPSSSQLASSNAPSYIDNTIRDYPRHANADYSRNNNSTKVARPSASEIEGMVAQVREVMGMVDETQVRSLLKQFNFDLEQTINYLLAG